MALKVAICGLWSETRPLIPWDDPTWEKWGLTWDAEVFQMDRAFEMHRPQEWKAYAPADYLERLRMMPRLCLYEAHPEVPEATVYPFDDVAKTTGYYWSSSVAFLMALAIHEQAEEIALYGIAMEGHDEYAFQRPNMEYLIGLARGKGIKVHVPEASPIARYASQYGYRRWYGDL